MSTRTSGRLAWSMWAIFMACIGFGLLLQGLRHPSSIGTALSHMELEPALAFVGFATIGSLIAARRPENAIGWIFCTIGLGTGVVFFAEAYADYALVTRPGSLPGGQVMAWIYQTVWALNKGLLVTFVLLLFPNGRLPSPRWRPVAWLAAGTIAVYVVSQALKPGPIDDYPATNNPVGIEHVGGISELLSSNVGDGLLLALLFLSALSVIVRFRHAKADERQQLKWFAYAAGLLVVFFVANDFLFPLVGDLLFIVGIALLPISVVIAILRHRLFDIDILINRTLVYGALTVGLALVYVGSVIMLQQLFRTLTGQESDLAIVASTLAIAALFNPLRQRLQAFIDKRFYRRKYDAAKTLAAFSARLRNETDLDALTADLLTVVDETVQPAHVSLWLPQVPERGGSRNVNDR